MQLPFKKKDALVCLIVTCNEVVYLHEATVDISAKDVLLIQTLIRSSESMRTQQKWDPICLPSISDSGFLQIYCNFFSLNFGVVFLTENIEFSMFQQCSEQAAAIYSDLCSSNIHQVIDFECNAKYSSEQIHDSFSEDVVQLNLVRLLASRDTNSKPFYDAIRENKKVLCMDRKNKRYFSKFFNKLEEATKEDKATVEMFSQLYSSYLSAETSEYFEYKRGNELTCGLVVNPKIILFVSFHYFVTEQKAVSILTALGDSMSKNLSKYFG